MNIVPYNEIKEMSLAVAKSGLFGLKSVDQAVTLMLIAQSENIHPVCAMQMYDIINGKPALKSSEVLSRFQKSGGTVEWIETNDKIAKAKFMHPAGGSIIIEWSMERAKNADLTGKDNWRKYPAQMLRARCISEGVRAIYPACLNNMYSSEEVADFTQPNNTVIEVEAIPVQKKENNDEVNKKILATQLKKFDFSNQDLKDFGIKFQISDKPELVAELIKNQEMLIEYINDFENK